MVFSQCYAHIISLLGLDRKNAGMLLNYHSLTKQRSCGNQQCVASWYYMVLRV